jgi:benzoate-CoA ligase
MGYNAAADLLDRHLPVRADKCAYIDAEGAYSYGDLHQRAARAGNALRGLGLSPGDRVLLCMLDGIDLVAAFLGAMQAGLIPVPLNTLLQCDDYAYLLADSGARAAIVSPALLPTFALAITASRWNGVLLLSEHGGEHAGAKQLRALMQAASATPSVHLAREDDPAFWLYSSGSTGRPKGAVHLHQSLRVTADRYGSETLGVREDDVVFSAAKLFFAYGLGNALTFPLAVGATIVLLPGRATPEAVCDILVRHRATLFFGVPTLYAALIAHMGLPKRGTHNLRLCVSAGEALPAEIGRGWNESVGVEIVDGIGSTEMLHIFVSNRPGAARYGVTGKPVVGYEVRLVDEADADVEDGALGEMLVRGASAATHYWNNEEKTRATFQAGWVRTGDKFYRDPNGDYVHCGRNDDMLKIGGIWVSPMEVESALIAHEAVLEAAVIGVADGDGLIKTKAFVVLKPGYDGDDALARTLQDFVKARLPPYKYPRQVAFVASLPKTATGKIRRHVLRDQEQQAS